MRPHVHRNTVLTCFGLLILLLLQALAVSSPVLVLERQPPSFDSGGNSDVEIGIYKQADPPAQIDAPKGGSHTCVVEESGGLTCFGDNVYGKLGDGTATDRTQPTQVAGLSNGVTKVATGGAHTCALLTNGSVMCWGYNGDGNLGDGTTTTRYSPAYTDSLGAGRYAVDIAAGDSHTCVILDDGSVKCWGGGGGGRLGDGSQSRRTSPVQTNSLGVGRTAVAISLGAGHSCALLDDGSIKCWGLNDYGQIGLSQSQTAYVNPTSITAFTGGRTAVGISAGWKFTCAVLNDGNVSCWGMGVHGELGNNGTSSSWVPTYVTLDGITGTFERISSGYMSSCGILNTSQTVCWGWNGKGQIGDGSTTNRLVPTGLANLSLGDAVVNITASMYHTCASFVDGSLRCWGDNNDGRLGVDFSSAQTLTQPSGRPIGAIDATRVTETTEGQNVTYLIRIHGLSTSNFSASIQTPVGMNVDFSNWTDRKSVV